MDTIDRDKQDGTRGRRGTAGRAALTVVFGMLLSLLGVGVAYGLTLTKQLPDLVAESEWIVEADLVSAQARWNSRGNLIVTDYRFHAVRMLSGMPPGSDFVLSQGGGTLGDITDEISDTPQLGTGNRYLLFVRPDRGEVFSPFVGGAQGVYLVRPDGTLSSLGADRMTVERSVLFDRVDELIARRGATPARMPVSDYVPETPYPAKDYLPIALTPATTGDSQAAEAGTTSAYEGPDAPSSPSPVDEPPPVEAGESDVVPNWVVPRKVDPPAVINQLTPALAPWSPVDQNMMAEWNKYGGNIFRVYTTPTETWAWGNGVFDMAGFPTDAQMIAQFGEGWGASTLGITYSRWTGNTIIEADVALNPAFCWTLDEARAQDSSNACWSFRQTMLHELGHVWGLAHPWETQDVWWDSVMNYSPKAFRIPLLFTDDAHAVRTAFGGPDRHDALISLYTTQSRDGNTSPTYKPTQPGPKTVKHGQNLAQGNNQFRIENLGTDVIATPKVDFHLVPSRLSWTGNRYLGSETYASVPVYTSNRYWMPSLTVSAATPTGDYYLGAYLAAADYNSQNNSAWATQTLRIANNPALLTPTENRQISAFGYIGPSGDWEFRFDAVAGRIYGFSMCEAQGGSADFDTTLSVYDASMIRRAYNDDACGRASAVTFTAATSGRFSVIVRGYNNAAQGRFRMAYWLERGDPIFRNGFEP